MSKLNGSNNFFKEKLKTTKFENTYQKKYKLALIICPMSL